MINLPYGLKGASKNAEFAQMQGAGKICEQIWIFRGALKEKVFIVRNIGFILLFVILGFPALEIYSMFLVAGYIGWWLLLWLIVSAVFGWLLIKEESLAVFGRLALTVQNGQSPFAAIWDSGRTMLAGVLLIFPGAISDVVALILLLLPNKADRSYPRSMPDDGIIEGEVRVVEAEQIELKSKPKPH